MFVYTILIMGWFKIGKNSIVMPQLIVYSHFCCYPTVKMANCNAGCEISENLPVKIEYLQTEVKGCSSKIKNLSVKLSEQDQDISAMREELRQLLLELADTKTALRNIADKL